MRNLPPTVNHLRARGDLKVGSLVLVREDNVKRMHWPIGKVKKVFPGRDGVVRSVELQTAKGHLLRSIQRLHQLEIAEPLAECNEDNTPSAGYVTRYGRASKPVQKFNYNG